MKRLLRRPVVQRMLASLLSRYLRFALNTTQWTLYGEEHLAPLLAGTPAVVAFWHERLPLMTALWRHAQQGGTTARMVVLVSRHSDGRFIGDILRRFDLGVAHGSSSRDGRDRGGAAGLRSLLEHLAAGGFVGITPDGPRGPRRLAAQGVAQLAALSGVPVLPCSAQTSRRWQLRSWDRMVIPRPFGRGVVVCLPSITVERAHWRTAMPAIEAALTRAADQADAACPA